MREPLKPVVIPTTVHHARLDMMGEIMAALMDDVTGWTGTESTMNAVRIAPASRAMTRSSASRKVFAVWFLPGTTADGHETLINHGIDFELDAPHLKIATWGHGYTAEAKLRVPHHESATDAEEVTFWRQVDETARAVLHPALDKPDERCPNCGAPMHGAECMSEGAQ